MNALHLPQGVIMYSDILLCSKKHSLILFSTWGLAGQTNPLLENEGIGLLYKCEYNQPSRPGLWGGHI